MDEKNKVYNALDIARYIINYSIDNSYPVSNLKLQKLLYYVQANFLVNKNKQCFYQEILNWDYGPVIMDTYNEFRGYGRDYLPYQKTYGTIEFDGTIENIKYYEKEFDECIIENSDKELINKVISSYFSYDAFDMVNKTHTEDPWKLTNKNECIDIETIKNYYKLNTQKLIGDF